jgi:microcin C transport system substrate-binding protein
LPENPRTDTGAYARRANLLHARDLLNQAGWTLGPDGRLRNRQGQTLDFEFLGDDLGSEKVITAWQRNLERLGIHVTYRVVDPAVYLSRIQNFDFDAIRMSLGNFLVPSAALMDSFLSSQNALLPASNNYMGAHNAAIDQALAAMSQAQTMGELVTATRALDRVFVCEHFAIPLLYRPFSDVAYWDRFGIPERAPRFFSIDEGYGTLPWPLETWWDKSVQ